MINPKQQAYYDAATAIASTLRGWWLDHGEAGLVFDDAQLAIVRGRVKAFNKARNAYLGDEEGAQA